MLPIYIRKKLAADSAGKERCACVVESKDLIKETVIHKAFGKGVIRNAYGKILEIDFPQYGKHSKFIYPSCFDGFLRLEKEEKEKDVAEDLKQWRISSGAEEKEKLRQQYQKTQQAIKARRMAAEEKKQRLAQRNTQRKGRGDMAANISSAKENGGAVSDIPVCDEKV